jgi:hypothetical protein
MAKTQTTAVALSTAQEVYDQVVKSLAPSERFKLATLILNDISPSAVVDYSDEWSEEDIRDLTIATWKYAVKSLGEEEQDTSGA